MFSLSVILSKLINLLINLRNLGSGYTWPGHIVLFLFPNILKSPKIKFDKGLIILSGTNGKTTTAKLITHILEKSQYTVVSNMSGANLKNGVATSLLLSSNIKGLNTDFGVFEVDEFALPEVLEDMSPDVLILLNLSRDQLDRYGEVDTILGRWKDSLNNLSKDTILIVDKDQKDIMDMCKEFEGDIRTFGKNDSYLEKSSLEGSFNARNIDAASSACEVFGIDESSIQDAITSFKPAYGRGETIEYLGVSYHIFLAKNPASFNFNLDVVNSVDRVFSSVLVVLNDNIPDGRDVSWIYDINSSKLNESFRGKHVYFAGTRGVDMALRFKHAGVIFLESDIFSTLDGAFLEISRSGVQNVLVLPNYSSMLEVRDFLIGRKIL